MSDVIKIIPEAFLRSQDVVLYRGDARDIMAHLPMCNAIITDPPYDSLNEHSARGNTTRLAQRGHKEGGGVNWFATLPISAILLTVNGGNVLPDGASYVFCDPKTVGKLAGFWPANNILVWDKMRIGMGYNWRRMHEFIAYYPQKKHRLRKKGYGDILRVKPVQKKVHPTEKPVDLIRIILENSTKPGDLVIDPFMGSGSTGIACIESGRKFIGIEIDPDMFQIATERIAATTPNQRPLP